MRNPACFFLALLSLIPLSVKSFAEGLLAPGSAIKLSVSVTTQQKFQKNLSKDEWQRQDINRVFTGSCIMRESSTGRGDLSSGTAMLAKEEVARGERLSKNNCEKTLEALQKKASACGKNFACALVVQKEMADDPCVKIMMGDDVQEGSSLTDNYQLFVTEKCSASLKAKDLIESQSVDFDGIHLQTTKIEGTVQSNDDWESARIETDAEANVTVVSLNWPVFKMAVVSIPGGTNNQIIPISTFSVPHVFGPVKGIRVNGENTFEVEGGSVKLTWQIDHLS